MIPVLCFVSTLLSLTHNNNDYGGNEEKEKKKRNCKVLTALKRRVEMKGLCYVVLRK